MPVRPHSTIFISHTAPMQIPEGQETPFNAPHEPSRTPSSPHKGTPPEMNELENRVHIFPVLLSACMLHSYYIIIHDMSMREWVFFLV